MTQESLPVLLLGLSWKLGLVLALIYAVLWVAKRLTRVQVGRDPGQLRVVETVGLGPNRSLHLVQVGGRLLLVGATAQEITALADLTGVDAVVGPYGEAEGEGNEGERERADAVVRGADAVVRGADAVVRPYRCDEHG